MEKLMGKLIFVGLLVSIIAFSAQAALVSKWSFGEAANSTTIADSSGNGHSGALSATGVSIAGPGTGWDGKSGAAYFDGTGGYITCTNGAGEYLPGKYLADQATISFWEKADSDISSYGAIFSAYTIRCVMTYGGTVYWDTYASSLTTGIQPSDYQATWSFWTLTRDANSGNGTLKIYRNGLPIATGAGGYPAINSYGDIKIGIDGSGGIFKGYIGEMRVYNNAMSDAEVLALYNNYISPTPLVLTNVFNTANTGTRNDLTARLGYSFTAEKDFQVNALGRPVNGVLQGSHEIQIFDVNTVTLLASVILNSTSQKDSLGYAFEPLAVPITLTQDREYLILSTEVAGGDPWMDGQYVTDYKTDYITINGAEYTTDVTQAWPGAISHLWGTDAAYAAPALSIGNPDDPAPWAGIFVTASHVTSPLTIDGQTSDWAVCGCGAQHQGMEGDAAAAGKDREHDIAYAWDNDNLYVLIQETVVDNYAVEGSYADWAEAPYEYDGMGITFPKKTIWLGVSSTGGTGRILADNRGTTGTLDPIGSVTHSMVNGKRITEVSIPWVEILTSPYTVSKDLEFSANPLIVDSDPENWVEGFFSWDPYIAHQSFIGGNLWSIGDVQYQTKIRLGIRADLYSDSDCTVNLKDLAVFATSWLSTTCNAANNWCNGADLKPVLTKDGKVDFKDFVEFASYWLQN